MRFTVRCTALAAIILITCSTAFGAARPGPLARLPKAVQATAKAQIGAGQVTKVAKQAEGGETLFDIHFTRDGTNRLFTVDAEGELRRYQVFGNEVPEAARKILLAQIGTAKHGNFYRVVDEGDTTYETLILRGDNEFALSVAEDGKSYDLELPLGETPAAVQATVRKETAGGQVSSLTRVYDDGDVTYDVEFKRAGAERRLSVDAKGKLIELELGLEESPDGVQRSIQELLKGGTLDSITKSLTEVQPTYDVDIVRSGTLRSYTIDEKGSIIIAEMTLEELPAAVRTAVEKRLNGAKVLRIERNTTGGKTSYEVEARNGAIDVDFTVGENGKD